MKKRIIRPLEAGDTNDLLTFVNTLIAEDTYLMLSGDKMTFTQERTYVVDSLARMKRKEKIHIVVADHNSIVASAEIRRGDRRKRHVGEIGISILAPYREQGLGSELMRRVISEGKRLGLRMLMLHCFENNKVALALYKKFGFTVCGILPGALYYRGHYIGEVTLYKDLA